MVEYLFRHFALAWKGWWCGLQAVFKTSEPGSRIQVGIFPSSFHPIDNSVLPCVGVLRYGHPTLLVGIGAQGKMRTAERQGGHVSSAVYCSECGAQVQQFRNPAPTVDIIVALPQKQIVLIERKNPPFGWALPGGFVDYGESLEQAARREAEEETGLTVQLLGLVGVYSAPQRDPRQHTLSVAFAAQALDAETLRAGDDAARAQPFSLDALPDLAFDHAWIVADYQSWRSAQGVAPIAPVREGKTSCIL